MEVSESYRFSEFFTKLLDCKEIKIRGINEQSGFNQFFFNYKDFMLSWVGMKASDLRNTLFNVGVLPYEWEKEDKESKLIDKLQEKYRIGRRRNHLPVLGLDTNLIYSGFYLSKLKYDLQKYVGWNNPFIILTLSSSYEMHYKSSKRYYNNYSSYNKFMSFIDQEEGKISALVNEVLKKPGTSISKSMYKVLPDSEGRLGYRGMYNFSRHRLEPNTTIVKSVVSIEDSIKELEKKNIEVENIDSIYDIQIAKEFNLYASYTNTEEIILTMDKDFFVMLDNAGIDAIYVERVPSRGLPEQIVLKQRELADLIRQLLIYSPYIVIEGRKEIVLSSCWFAESEESLAEGKIHGTLYEEEEIKHIWITD